MRSPGFDDPNDPTYIFTQDYVKNYPNIKLVSDQTNKSSPTVTVVAVETSVDNISCGSNTI